MTDDNKEKRDEAAKALIEACGLGMMEAAGIILELKHSIDPGRRLEVADCIRRLRVARHVLQEEAVPVTLREGVERLLESKTHRREATQRELRYYTKKLVTENPHWAEEELRSLTPDICREMLKNTYGNEHTRRKARVILHGLFSFCQKNGWVERNPIHWLPESPLPEREKRPLNLEEIRRLLETVVQPDHRACAAAAGIMLWSGIRPTEVTRLSWRHIHCKTRTITLHALHAKTGGSRCVSMQPVLVQWLKRLAGRVDEDAPVCPKGWIKRWSRLHHACGLHPWVPDILRHSFASYHAVHFRDLERLRYEMGHHSLNLLKFRYMSTSYISRQQAACFWRVSYWEPLFRALC